MKKLAGKVALVTGGSRGAGRGIAIELGKAGAIVYVSGRSLRGATTNGFPGSIDDTVEEILKNGGEAYACRCDHTRDEDTQALIERIRQEQGRLQILVNNVWGLHDLEVNLQPKAILGISAEHVGGDVSKRDTRPTGDQSLCDPADAGS